VLPWSLSLLQLLLSQELPFPSRLLVGYISLAIKTRNADMSFAGAESVTDVENLKVTATVTNTGSEAVKILNDPRGVLNKLPTNTFAITDAAGASPKFAGAKVKYVPEAAIAHGQADAFTVLAPGQSVSVEHNRKSVVLVIEICY
jgi:peptidyl-Lys metalloendopeptidase